MKRTTEPGTIKAYNAGTGIATVELRSSRSEVRFAVTCFDSGRRVRPPHTGEPVQVVFSETSTTPLAVVSTSDRE